MEDKKYITQLYASTPRPTIKRTLVKIFKEYCYYQTGPPCRDDGSIFYVCKEKTTENIKCQGRGYLHNNVFYEIIGHNHPINENDNLRRLFKDEMFEVCLMFPNRSERLLYNEIIEE
ncbi:hypothetical protein HCN44_005590 [Aphidius gifuensis]|uniref:Uncharacterized protein n=1 Tax=Aphidius gifuensis TaxID=684658 RepID=A0A834Y550_APHGI|nr:uncharacterized protein LOC122847945 [Aphidius gifuensis]KAF7997313.1 hypothetical protein HCN44_005590 [Aphidius gifuensis]